LKFRLSILAVALVGLLPSASAQTQPRLTGYTISVEGGVEGKQEVQYDANGKPIGGNLPFPVDSTMKSTTTPLNPAANKTANSRDVMDTAAAPIVKGLYTEDGRRLPFSIEGKGPDRKMVDNNVDFNSGLKKVTKLNDMTQQRYDTKMAPVSRDEVYNRSNMVTFESWHRQFDSIGRRKADIDLADTLGASVKQKDLVEVKSVEFGSSPWSRQTSNMSKLDARMTTEKNSSYNVTPLLAADRAKPKSVDQLSMQDINRYQFRRNRSDAPGLPFVRPGSENVQTTGSNPK
jgi:hypothetical protein